MINNRCLGIKFLSQSFSFSAFFPHSTFTSSSSQHRVFKSGQKAAAKREIKKTWNVSKSVENLVTLDIWTDTFLHCYMLEMLTIKPHLTSPILSALLEQHKSRGRNCRNKKNTFSRGENLSLRPLTTRRKELFCGKRENAARFCLIKIQATSVTTRTKHEKESTSLDGFSRVK